MIDYLTYRDQFLMFTQEKSITHEDLDCYLRVSVIVIERFSIMSEITFMGTPTWNCFGKNQHDWPLDHNESFYRDILQLSGGRMRRIGRPNWTVMKSLTRIEIAASVMYIDERDFENWELLEEVTFASNSNMRTISGFCKCLSLRRVIIPPSVESIVDSAFSRCPSLTEVIFEPDSQLTIISGFCDCASLRRIAIPSSVEDIDEGGFCDCDSLNEVIFSSDSRLQHLGGFCNCPSLCHIEIPSSVEEFDGLLNCQSLHLIVIRTGSHLRQSELLLGRKAFMIYEDEIEHLKQQRHRIPISEEQYLHHFDEWR
jgi:hypothetical protein